MELIRQFLFESPLLVLGLAVVAVAVLVAAYRRGHVQGARRGLLITAAVTAGLLLLQVLVVTDREALRTLIVKLAEDVGEGDVGGIGEGVDPAGVDLGTGQRAAHCTKDAWLSACNVGLQRYQIEKPSPGAFQFDINGAEATVSFRVLCDIRQGQASEWRVPSFWTVRCAKGPDGWKLRGILKANAGIEGFVSALDLMTYLRDFWSAGSQGSSR